MEIDIHDILIQPLITEKATELRENLNKVAFVVHPKANKHMVKRAVEELLKVKVEKVNIMNMRGKKKALGRFEGKRPDWKKAIVTLKKGEKIDIFEG